MFDFLSLPENHAIAILKEDHELVKKLFKRFEETENRSEREKIVADQTKYLRLMETLVDFHSRLETMDVPERQKVLRLLVKEILVGRETITIRHSIRMPNPTPDASEAPRPAHTPETSPTAQPDPCYLLRSGRHYCPLRSSLYRRPLRSAWRPSRSTPLSAGIRLPSSITPASSHFGILAIDSVPGKGTTIKGTQVTMIAASNRRVRNSGGRRGVMPSP